MNNNTKILLTIKLEEGLFSRKGATQVIKLNDEAYRFYTSSQFPSSFQRGLPDWKKEKMWKKLTPHQRLLINLQRTAEHFGGKSFTFQILD